MNLEQITKQLVWFVRIMGFLVVLGLVIYCVRFLRYLG